MSKYIPQEENTTADEFVGRIRELKDKITRRNKQIKYLMKKIDQLQDAKDNDIKAQEYKDFKRSVD